MERRDFIMKQNHYKSSISLGSLLLLVCLTPDINAQEPAGPKREPRPGEQRQRQPAPDGQQRPQIAGAPKGYQRALAQPFNSVRVLIRYKKQYGYKSDYTYTERRPTSCSAFSVVLAKPARPVTPNLLIPVTRDEVMTEDDDYYYCQFLVSELGLDQNVTITASVRDTDPWLNGSQSRLPSGWRRAISDGTRTVSLTQGEPKARINFEMVYEPMREFLDRRPPGSIVRKP